MARLGHLYVADGFANDCDMLIDRCTQAHTLNYEKFCEIWKEMNFVYIFHNRPSEAEIAELSEEVLHIAKHYMVVNTSNFEESVAGLFLVYALLNLQPYPGFASLRLVQEDIPALDRIELVARRERRYDVLYILGSVLIKGPVQYHAEQRERGIEFSIRKYMEGYRCVDKMGVRPKGVFYRQNEELDIIRELNALTRHYSQAKAIVCGAKTTTDRSLSYINENLPRELDMSLKKLVTGIIDDDDDDDEITHKDDSAHYNAVRSIKEKAMSNIANPMKRFMGVNQKLSESKSLQQSNAKSRKKRQRSDSSEKKEKANKGSNPIKKKLKNMPKCILDTDDEDDYIQPIGEDDESNVETDNSDEESDEMHLSEKVNEELNIPETEQEIIQNMDIKIDSLPVLMKSEQDGKTVEIEIIDQYKHNPSSNERSVGVIESVGELPDLNADSVASCSGEQSKNPKRITRSSVVAKKSPKKPRVAKQPASKKGKSPKASPVRKKSSKSPIDNKSTEPSGPFVSNDSNDVIPRLPRRERRELKQTILKSKFKRMGMLSMANFSGSDDD